MNIPSVVVSINISETGYENGEQFVNGWLIYRRPHDGRIVVDDHDKHYITPFKDKIVVAYPHEDIRSGGEFVGRARVLTVRHGFILIDHAVARELKIETSMVYKLDI